MRVERLTYNKIKIFLTFDDLKERGISKDEIWQDIPKVHQLFRDMMTEADDEVGFKADGPIAVEVFALPAQGMVVIVTKGHNEYELEDEYDDDYIEMQVTLDESDEIFYEFSSFEDVIALAQRLKPLNLDAGVLYSFENCFYLKFEEHDLTEIELDTLIALMAEFGSSSTITSHRVIEYGKALMDSHAISQINKYFN
ncbi:genetic competence negative regulator [Fictibacillus enclensis]|uniref:Adapter protein MecA n=1 Tax=Fictibacillus enclensis TaxID=1017270 RepID=A0A0V8JEV2_9BACL|nr:MULTISPECIES: genetic competence negative regulator [Fictibacillus]KSU85607.1 adaptor protein [Fictibacillus enclensis]MDM5199548.1 genetic competence negative regulator [Fictibacillus enclensis]MDM5338786.1 genetic competence negative regulator [Fictibacillus enclensis]RXY98699.1 genetic competence negative regulator [Fictibacillus sp. S7]WHY70282.1 genetic competence negative regulator [Fictibacillus enclensis]